MTSKAKRTPNDWHAALCNAKSSSNVWLHLQRKHRHTTKDAGLMKEFEKKDARKRKAFSTTMKTSMKKNIAIKTAPCGSNGKLQFVMNEKVLNSLSTFLIRSGVAFNAIDNEDFKTFYRLSRSDSNAKVLGRSVHNANIDSYHDEFKGLFVKALSSEMKTMLGIPFLNLMHDMWTSKSVKAVLGVSLSYIDCNWRKVYLALFVRAHKGGHSVQIVSNMI